MFFLFMPENDKKSAQRGGKQIVTGGNFAAVRLRFELEFRQNLEREWERVRNGKERYLPTDEMTM